MGYAWNGICYQDTASALDAFAKSIPSADAAGMNSFSSAPSIDPTGLVSWSIVNRPFNGGMATTQTGTVQLQSCTEGMDQWSVQTESLIIGLFLAFVIGFMTGFRP